MNKNQLANHEINCVRTLVETEPKESFAVQFASNSGVTPNTANVKQNPQDHLPSEDPDPEVSTEQILQEKPPPENQGPWNFLISI